MPRSGIDIDRELEKAAKASKRVIRRYYKGKELGPAPFRAFHEEGKGKEKTVHEKVMDRYAETRYTLTGTRRGIRQLMKYVYDDRLFNLMSEDRTILNRVLSDTRRTVKFLKDLRGLGFTPEALTASTTVETETNSTTSKKGKEKVTQGLKQQQQKKQKRLATKKALEGVERLKQKKNEPLAIRIVNRWIRLQNQFSEIAKRQLSIKRCLRDYIKVIDDIERNMLQEAGDTQLVVSELTSAITNIDYTGLCVDMLPYLKKPNEFRGLVGNCTKDYFSSNNAEALSTSVYQQYYQHSLEQEKERAQEIEEEERKRQEVQEEEEKKIEKERQKKEEHRPSGAFGPTANGPSSLPPIGSLLGNPTGLPTDDPLADLKEHL